MWIWTDHVLRKVIIVSFLTLPLAFAVVLLNISCGTCLTATWSSDSGLLAKDEAEEVYQALEKLVNNDDNYIQGPEREWEERSHKTHSLEQPMQRLHVHRHHQRQRATGGTQLLTPNPSPLSCLLTDSSYKVLSHGAGNSVDDCTIQPYMLLSHNSAHAFNQLYLGDSLLSPNAKYKLTIPKSGRVMAPCVLKLEDQDGNIKWQNYPHAHALQNNCFLTLTSDGKLELWNNNNVIWQTVSACSPPSKCAGVASLAVEDSGDVELYRSVGNYLGVYWSAMRAN
ncbi:hypothetical protein SUGI_1084010 [Cryptomeria japonica]|nr:hypothetical protein SUGI_1084010 [Cryptomeria japonica]